MRPLEATDSPFLNANSTKFVVNGTGIPDVDFDIGDSYAGSLPIRGQEDSNLFFWFFPTSNPDPKKEIVIWLNGGPGCSSLVGLLQENGPFLWQTGTFKPVLNPWSWHTLTNMVWIEQPVGTGFSEGPVTAANEEDVAKQFMGFWMNFVETFALQGYKVYIAGESYAGMYCPYIADAFINANDTVYFDMSGVLMYDPVISNYYLQTIVPATQFVTYWSGLFPFNDTFREKMHKTDKDCGLTKFVNDHLVYPPKGNMPNSFPGEGEDGQIKADCTNALEGIMKAIMPLNPCFNIYQITTTCPLLWDVVGFPGSMEYLPDGAEIYFDRPDVKRAINAPLDGTWSACSHTPVFTHWSDDSTQATDSVLPHVIDTTKNVIIAHGALDFVLIANGTLLVLQNMTWGGKVGFQRPPTEPFYVPNSWLNQISPSTAATAGVAGTLISERGLTYVGIANSGHMVPMYAPSAAFRTLEFLLGRVDCMNCTKAFTTETYSIPQSDQPMGNGTAPRGWSTGL
ncbi:carboxypeptidase cpdS precursor [Schizothecium vesticola]|uniref:Carboxypeptidase n=1 Tax=Schizothecium vesticola TaxID=314040 RepID=A0AA40FB80_9PEZI|nr:carboxypeptidase cpdS precursor [Schizothecium vesticola]